MDARASDRRRFDRTTRRGPVASVVAASAWLLCGAARAEAPETSRCLAAQALAGLTQPEQQRLTAACTQASRPGPGLAPLLSRLAARASWEAAALGDLLVGAAPHLDLGPEPADVDRLRDVRGLLLQSTRTRRQPQCKALDKALADYFADRDAGDVPTPPFAADTLAGCVTPGPEALAGLALLTIPADTTTRLFVAASAGERVVLQWFEPDEAVEHEGRRVHVVAVPRWSVVSVRATSSGSPTPQTWHGFVTYDQTVWDRAPAASCLRLSVDLDRDTTLLLDGAVLTRGAPLAHRTVGVFNGPHELVAVRCQPAGDCAVRFRETLAASPVAAHNLCQDVALDLHQRRSVAVLRVQAAPGCDAALAWRAGELAADHLRRSEAATGRVFRDLASYATITEALGTLRDGLNPGAGQAVGADTGADSLELVASVAKEAWRQGIDELVTLELRCSGDTTGLSLQGTAISVREVFDRSLGAVAGLDLKQMLRVQSLRFRGEAQLASTVAGVLDQLFARSYLRFREGPTSFAYRKPARVELVANGRTGADGTPLLVAHHLTDPHQPAPAACRALRTADHRAAVATAEAMIDGRSAARPIALDLQRDDTDPDAPDPRTAVAARIAGTFKASRPGTYLVTAAWRQPSGDSTAIADAMCVRFEVPPGELWASVMFAPDLGMRLPVADYAARHVRAMVGHTWYHQRPWLGLGVAGGYTYTRYNSEPGVPSWQNFTAPAAETHARLEWGRHALVIGPLVEFRSRRADIPVEFRGRLSAGVGFAVVDVRKLATLTDFAGSPKFGNSDLRLRPTLDATAELGFGYTVGPVAVGHFITLGAVALNDMLSSKQAVLATGGAGLFAGFSLLLGGAP